jgi:CubicO group peptidase (beta-lactamase class C family)
MTHKDLKPLIEDAVHKDGLIPSAVYVVAEKGDIRFRHACGTLNVSTGEAVTTETVYDLASLTKPLVTGLIAAILIENGRLSMGDSLASFFPDFAGGAKEEITIRHLAGHSSGLPAWIPFYLSGNVGKPKESAFSQIVSAELAANPGSEVNYSDLNFILLGFILEKITGMDLSEAASQMLFKPLCLSNTFFNPPAGIRSQIAASETGNLYEENMCRALFPERKIPDGVFRTGLIQGEVHDGNCFFLGGVAGHAGLFSNAFETFRLASQFLAGTSELLSAQTCLLFQRNLTPRLNQARSFSFQLAETRNSSAGPELPPESFGHLGFTGTSLWIEPEKERIYILLTNRTHNRIPPFPDLAVLRKNFNTSAHEMLENTAILIK